MNTSSSAINEEKFTYMTSRRDHSIIAVLSALGKANHQLTMTDVCHQTKLSRPTVKRILSELATLNLIHTSTAEQSHINGGRRPQLFSLNQQHHCALILRINSHVIDGFILDAAGNTTIHLTHSIDSAEKIVSELCNMTSKLLENIVSPILSTIVVVMGIVHNGRVIRSDSYPNLNDNQWTIDIESILANNGHDVSVIALNDAKTAARWMYHQISSFHYTPQSLIALHCSEELGCGLVFDGVVMEGAHGAAGEILQHHSGEWEVVSHYLRTLEHDYNQPIRKIFSSIAQESESVPFITKLGSLIGQALTPMVLTLDPDTLAIGGAIVDCGAPLIEAISAQLSTVTPTPPTTYATPQGTQSVEEGAKMRAIEEVHIRILNMLNKK
ncbi:ROK family protein [Arcanobacterium phocae]|uniref:ROK family protein n=1 Tax=Arcanobacterium phocae TaxID=131112 RepID=UPI001C1178DC|nr:ROK family transcriptional regulator [Arcanobacterium phocae]